MVGGMPQAVRRNILVHVRCLLEQDSQQVPRANEEKSKAKDKKDKAKKGAGHKKDKEKKDKKDKKDKKHHKERKRGKKDKDIYCTVPAGQPRHHRSSSTDFVLV